MKILQRNTAATYEGTQAHPLSYAHSTSNDPLTYYYAVIMDSTLPVQARLNAYYDYERVVEDIWKHNRLTSTERYLKALGIKSQSEFIRHIPTLSTEQLQHCILQSVLAANTTSHAPHFHLSQVHTYSVWQELYHRGIADLVSLHNWLEAVLQMNETR